MEAVPKLPLISFELKVSGNKADFGTKLKQYIAEAYREDPDSYSNEIHQLEGLWSTAVRPSSDAAGLSALYRYFCQLRWLQSRFPMTKGQPAACNFTWKDLYDQMNVSVADIRYEMACIIYNIGALHSQLGASEPRTSPESLKAACTHYQHAAWAFLYIREQFTQPPGGDMAADMMRLFQEICFAQAQECILDKSIQDTRKPSVVGAVATQVMFFYRNSLALLGQSSGKDNIQEIMGRTKLYHYWKHNLSFKTSYIGCIVSLYQGLHAEEQQKFGERVAFYQRAVDKLAEARKLAKYIEPIQITQEALTFTNDVVEGKRKAAKNENEFIYHEEVPDKDLLIDLKPVCLVKALPINFNDPEVSGPDIFARLVPMGAHEASSMYSEEKAKLLRKVVNQAEAKNTELTEFMSSLQLDQLEVLDSDQKIPQEIVDRCAAMNAKTEIIQTLVDSMNKLAEIISDVEHSLADIKNLIQEETLKEKEYQKVMGPRPPSIVQTELSRELHKYQEAHNRTHESNQVLHKAMTLHIANLRLLSQPLDVLQSKIPSIDNIEGLDRETMTEMQRVVGKAHEMQAQRDSLIQQLREAVTNDDITGQLLARAGESNDDIFKQELEKHTPTVNIIEQNLSAQENIINKLTSLYASYGDSRRLLSDVLRKRDGLINALITSYDTYEELLGKSQKGLEFYKKLAHNVSQLLARLRSTCQVQHEERSQMLAKQNKAPSPSPIPTTSAAPVRRLSDVTATPAPSAGSGTLKLKDYLPYMKNRPARGATPQLESALPSDAYYPESIYPTSVRPAPVGSEDMPQMQLPDGGAITSTQNPHNLYNRYGAYAPKETDPYSVQSYGYPATSKSYDKSEDSSNYSYTTPFTPPQCSTQIADPHYSNPYYSGTQNNGTAVTDSPNMSYNANHNNMNQYTVNVYNDPYASQMGPAPNDNQMGHLPNVNPNQMGPIPEAASAYNQNPINQDLNVNFSHMKVGPKTEPKTGAEYSQTYYSVQHPHVSTPNMATYSSAPQNSNTNMVPSQLPSDYCSLNYPYSSDAQNAYQAPISNPYNMPQQQASSYPDPTINPVSNAYTMPDQQFSYGSNYEAGITVYTNTDSAMTSTTSVVNAPHVAPASSAPFGYSSSENDPNYVNPAALAQLDAMDKPIKSHITGEALSYPFDQNTQMNFSTRNEQNPPKYNTSDQYPTSTQNYTTNYAFVDPTASYGHNYQNHPGFTYNGATGSYDYLYGSQNSFASYGNTSQVNIEPQDSNWSVHGVYTSAGACETVQSPSESSQMMPQESDASNQYYNVPYGYLTNSNQSNNVVPDNAIASVPASTNYGANVNQSTYMQSGLQDTSVTFSSNQVSTPKENLIEPPNFDQRDQNTGNTSIQSQPVVTEKAEVVETPQVPEAKPEVPEQELSAFDLLSDIDFTVEHTPLMPEIKVPQISETSIKKPTVTPKVEPVIKPQPKEEIIERPAKMDLFSDPSLLNNFMQEVKNLQNLVDSLKNKTASGLTLLDSKWKNFQDEQISMEGSQCDIKEQKEVEGATVYAETSKSCITWQHCPSLLCGTVYNEYEQAENMNRSRSIAMKHTRSNILTDVVPYDDSRLTLKSDPDAFINASYYKQLASWCIPLVISKSPMDNEYSKFWKAVLENRIGCVVCLLSEIEMQGKSYWPTAKGQSLDLTDLKVTLDDVTCTVHWTERKLSISSVKSIHNVTHYQINVFPAKIVCSPLVLLADKVLGQTYENRLSNQLCGAWIQCGAGAGRSALIALLIMVMCQVRAGQLDLCDMLDASCINLYKHRTNVLEDTKFLADAYRTALFYVQGVLCSGTIMFNGEAVSVQTGASVLPPAPPTSNQKHKYSRESFEEMKQAPGLKSGDMKDPLNFLDPLWSLKKK